MKKYYTKAAALICVVLLSFTSFSQNKNVLWTTVSTQKAITTKQLERTYSPSTESYFQLDLLRLKQQLSQVGSRGIDNGSTATISFPSTDGNFYNFSVLEASVMHPDLQMQYPDIRSYVGQGIENPSETIRFSITPKGFHGMILGTKSGTQFINPYSENGNIYSIFSKGSIKVSNEQFECEVVGDEMLESRQELDNIQRNANDGLLRDFRLALACTGEYAQFHGGTVPSVLAEMNVAITRVNGIYERDLSVTMTLVPNNNLLIFLDPNTDPYTNNSGFAMLGENQARVDLAIGNANYDIGHVFSTGGGGIASLGSTCVNGAKARGVTGLPSPVNDPFYVDYVAHEMGHQFGAPHTFNSDNGSCGGGNRTASNAYEPGSGTTIMAYAGICSGENVQNNSDDYFHQKSLQMMWDHIVASGACPPSGVSGNSAPTAEAGANFTIPARTPYKLTGSSTDVDGTLSHTFTWEQYDLTTNTNPPSSTSPDGPLVRSFKGTTSPTRYIPRLEAVLANPNSPSTTWEVLSLVNRPINFRLTVRDNDVRGGQTAVDAMTVTVDNSALEFRVTSQSTSGITWTPGETRTVTWNVGGSNTGAVNEANVNILLSTDGGLTFDTVLAANTPNDGSQDITVPSVSSTNCRIMVEAANNIFFNVNTQSFAVGATLSCNTYSSGTVNLPIADGLGTTSPQNGPPTVNVINVPDNVTIESINVTVDVSHTWVSDLLILLVHPDGSTDVAVWSGDCGNNDNINVTFEDGAPPVVCGSPTTGTFEPVEPLSEFSGLSSQGDWTILVADFFQGDIGTLNSWSMEICSTSSLSVNDLVLDELSIYPNPSNGQFNVSFNPRSGQDIVIEVFDISGRAILTKSYDNTGRFDEVIQLNNAASGIYLLSISEGQQKVTKKIIVD